MVLDYGMGLKKARQHVMYVLCLCINEDPSVQSHGSGPFFVTIGYAWSLTSSKAAGASWKTEISENGKIEMRLII